MKTYAPGLELRVGLSFVGFVCAYYYLDPAGTFLPFFAAVAVHELGHLLVLLALGTPVYALELHATGAILRTGSQSYARELLAAAGGPLASLLLLLAAPRIDGRLFLTDLLLLLWNLLPVFPLDGGRMLRAGLMLLLPERVAEGICRVLTAVTLGLCVGGAAALTCLLHVGLWPVLLAASLLLRVGIFPRTKNLQRNG